MLGVLRVLLLAPLLGINGAILLELPIILALSWLICSELIRLMAVPPTVPARAVMGFWAFMLLMAAELCLAMIGLDRSPAEHLRSYLAWDTALGLAGQIAFAVFPLLQLLR